MNVAESDKTAAPSLTVQALVEAYRTERMPQRYTTRRSYNVWLVLTCIS